MFLKKSIKKHLVLAASVSVLALSACSTQGASRYGGEHVVTPPVPCGTVMVPCGQLIEYHRAVVQPPAYLVPAPCPTVDCKPASEPPVIVEPPYEPPYVPPVVVEPPYEPPIVLPPPPLRPTCPEGTIPGYGGQDCIPITVPRK